MFTRSIDFVKRGSLGFSLIISFVFPVITKANQNSKWLNDLTLRPYILVLAEDCPSCLKLTRQTLKSCVQKPGAKKIFILALGDEKKMKTHLYGLKNYQIQYVREKQIKKLNMSVTPSLYNKASAGWLKGATQIKDFLEDQKNELCKS